MGGGAKYSWVGMESAAGVILLPGMESGVFFLSVALTRRLAKTFLLITLWSSDEDFFFIYGLNLRSLLGGVMPAERAELFKDSTPLATDNPTTLHLSVGPRLSGAVPHFFVAKQL